MVKELVENALDAGSTKVEITLLDGGRELIQVADDGRGMDREDAELALERHATSKLREAEGLFHILSFGFRGEAVPAIASVSRLTLTTRRPDDLEGTRIEVEGGALKTVEPCGAPRGTTFAVRDLFYATPARRKFLKRPETEVGHVTDTVIRLALARPDVGFTFRSNGRVVFQSPANADTKERIAAAIGKEIHPHLLPIHQNHGRYSVRGHIGSPAWSAPSNRSIYTFVNGRFVRDRQLLHAVGRAYAEALPQGRHPGLVIFLEMPPGELDVNVHPQKMEVRFSEPRGVYDAVYRSLTNVLRTGDWLTSLPEPAPGGGEGAAVPTRSHPVPVSPQPVFDWHTRARRAALFGGGFEAGGPGAGGGGNVAEAAAGLWPRPGDREAATGATEGAGWGSDGAGLSRQVPKVGSLRFTGQLAGIYLLCEAPSGSLLVIDRRAATERLVANELGRAFEEGGAEGQPFLFPAMAEIGVAEARILVGHLETLEALGLEMEPFGGTTFALKTVPGAVVGVDYRKLLTDLAGVLGQGAQGPKGLVEVLARYAGSKPTEALTDEEAEDLLEALERIGGVPGGMVEISLADLAKRFGR